MYYSIYEYELFLITSIFVQLCRTSMNESNIHDIIQCLQLNSMCEYIVCIYIVFIRVLPSRAHHSLIIFREPVLRRR